MEIFVVLVVIIVFFVIVSKVGGPQNRDNKPTITQTKKVSSSKALMVKKMIGNDLRIIYESAKIVENTSNYETFYSRLGVMLKLMKKFDVFTTGNLNTYFSYYIEMFEKCSVLEERRKQVFEHVHLNNSDVTCPHCGYLFEQPVNRKRKCPECKDDIYRVKDKQGVYLVKQEVNEYFKPKIFRTDKIVEQRFIENFPDLFRDYKPYFMEENIY